MDQARARRELTSQPLPAPSSRALYPRTRLRLVFLFSEGRASVLELQRPQAFACLGADTRYAADTLPTVTALIIIEHRVAFEVSDEMNLLWEWFFFPCFAVIRSNEVDFCSREQEKQARLTLCSSFPKLFLSFPQITSPFAPVVIIVSENKRQKVVDNAELRREVGKRIIIVLFISMTNQTTFSAIKFCL